jgi:hypothetical chaperone protein
MTPGFCGLDFGTSNSTVGIGKDGGAELCRLEAGRVTLPSAIFFGQEEGGARFGRAAIDAYIEGTEGRLLRALKSVLGSTLIDDTTLIRRRRVPMRDIIGMFLAHLKAEAERASGRPIDNVVLGRPVRFVDDDDEADARARDELVGIARARGFRHVETQFEPVAAALAYERSLAGEELALVVDLGGGTSDFAIARLSPARARATDRSQDILGWSGVHIGGTDFDRRLGIAHVMPHLGYHVQLGPKRLPLPRHLFHDLATWHRIPSLYTPQNMSYLKAVAPTADDPELVERLIDVLRTRGGHRLVGQVEAAKIELSTAPEARLRLATQPPVDTVITRDDLRRVVQDDATAIVAAIDRCCQAAGLRADDIRSVFLTGGSTAIPEIRRRILGHLPNARAVDGDMFGSVGLGLTIDAGRRFGAR